ncbi:hypothetical protein ACUOI6_23625, partial [Escherichia coli]
PAYGPQNDVTLKMPAFEWVHVQLHQQKGMISLSPPTICNSARLVQWRETQPPFDAAAAKTILSDTHDAELPIYRLAADDPDEENTLATAVFTLDANHVRWQIFDINRDDAKFHGEVRG